MTTTCLKCKHEAEGSPLECPKCGAVYAKLEQLVNSGQLIRSVRPPSDAEREAARLRQVEIAAMQSRTTDEALDRARLTGNWTGVPANVVQEEVRTVVLATTDHVPGMEIDCVRGLVSADYAYAFGAIFEEVAGLIRNVAGSGKSKQTLGFLATGRGEVLERLRFAALDQGANAVVGIRIDYEEFSGANQRGILVVTGTGTAVRTRPR